jgi:hypothetical protein
MTSARIEEEIVLLEGVFENLEWRQEGRWILLPRYSTPRGWVQSEVSICFQVKPAYPGVAPYGFYVREPCSLESGAAFRNVTRASDPPFAGSWIKFSWSPREWKPSADITSGSNLVNFALSFAERLAEGA